MVFSLVALALLDILIQFFKKEGNSWQHIQNSLLLDYISTSFFLGLASILLAFLISVTLAYIMVNYKFPFKNFMKFALILPLSIPPYIAAYTYAGILSYTGDLQQFLRRIGVEVDQGLFSIMNFRGAVFIFVLFLYPYVYMPVYSYLSKNTATLIESARTLGRSKISVFFTVIIPLLRVPIVAGSSLMVLEILSDYGLVSYFGINTFTRAIFKTWIDLSDINSAIRLSAILLLFVLSFKYIEQLSRGRRRYSISESSSRETKERELYGIKKFLVITFVYGVFALSFVIPISQMIIWSIYSFETITKDGLFEMTINTVVIALLATITIVVLSIIVSNFNRLAKSKLSKFFLELSSLGYSIPAAIIAINMLVIFVDIDKVLKTNIKSTLLMLFIAYIIRFLAVGINNIEPGFQKLGIKYHESSRVLGYSDLKTFAKIDLPLMKLQILGAFMICFVDIIKDLTLVLILRPFNFSTLSTKVFEYAHDEMIPESSLASLIIVSIAISFLLCFYLIQNKKRNWLWIY